MQTATLAQASYLANCRYTGLQAGCISDSTDACLLAKQAGLDVLPYQGLGPPMLDTEKNGHSPAHQLAGRLMAFLGEYSYPNIRPCLLPSCHMCKCTQ